MNSTHSHQAALLFPGLMLLGLLVARRRRLIA
jgi:MYXO-CTERM domain-containing protein